MFKRPLFWAFIFLGAGIFAGLYLNLFLLFTVFIILILAALVRIITKRSGKESVWLGVFLLCALLGAVEISYQNNLDLKPISRFFDKFADITCVIVEKPDLSGDNAVYFAKAISVSYLEETVSVNEKIRISTPKEGDGFRDGDTITVHGRLAKPLEALNEGGFDYSLYLKTKGVFYTLFAPSGDIKLADVQNPLLVADRLRRIKYYISGLFEKYMKDKEDAAMLSGIVLGDDDEIPEELMESMRVSGVIHVASVSGMHVAYLLAAVLFLIGLGVKRRKYLVALITGVPLLILFAVMIGGVSVIRASVMGIVFLIANLFYKDLDSLTSLGVSGLVVLVLNPFSLFDIGFLLSFGATLGIILYARPIEYYARKLVKIRLISSAVAITIAAQLTTVPITAYVFSNVPVLSAISNVLITPVMPVIFIGGILLGIAGTLPYAGSVLGYVLSIFLKVFIWITDAVSAIPFATADIAGLNFIHLVIYCIVLVILFMVLYKQDRFKIQLACIGLGTFTATIFVLGFFLVSDMAVSFINVGQGDSALIKCPGGKTVLIDAGSNSSSDVGKHVVVPYLKKKGVRYIDVIFVSHFHDDHVGGIPAIMKEIKTGAVVIPYMKNEDNELRRMLILAAEESGVPVYTFMIGDGVRLSNKVELNALAPDKELLGNAENHNNNSLILKTTYGEMDFLFMGDLEKEGEAFLEETFPDSLDCEVLKVGHHGSKTSSTQSFLEKADPDYAVISVGRNIYGHPAQEVLDRFGNLKTKVFRTDINGDITFITDNRKIKSIKTFKGE